jgi:hypothetical protein
MKKQCFCLSIFLSVCGIERTKMKNIFFSLSLALVAGMATSSAQNVYIPDINFKTALLSHDPVIDTNGDGEIQLSEARAFAGALKVFQKKIRTLTGIEAFTALTELYCAGNQLTSLDLSNNTALTYLSCSDNQLVSLDVSGVNELTDLYCSDNQLTSLDVSGKEALIYLHCGYNRLSFLNVAGATALIILLCNDNLLTSLDVSEATALIHLSCSENLLTSLDVSGNMVLNQLLCTDNQLVALNVANGNNSNFLTLWTSGNPDLTCIQVDDVVYSTTNWMGYFTFTFDADVNFSEECSTVTSANERSSVSSFTFSPNPANDFVSLSDLPTGSRLSVLDVSGRLVYNAVITNTGTTTINTADFTSGVYTIRVENNGGIANKKMVVNK